MPFAPLQGELPLRGWGVPKKQPLQFAGANHLMKKPADLHSFPLRGIADSLAVPFQGRQNHVRSLLSAIWYHSAANLMPINYLMKSEEPRS